jgi:hypothetical protein
VTAEHIKALETLNNALNDFLESGLQSEGSGNVDDPHTGMDPDQLDCESIDCGGEIHNAVCSVQPFYGGKLPAPAARNFWRELQQVCRHETDLFVRQNEAHRCAGDLQNWVLHEIEKFKPEPSNYTLVPEEVTILEALANEPCMTVTREDLIMPTRLSEKTIGKYLDELQKHGFVHRPRGSKKGCAITPAGLAAISPK